MSLADKEGKKMNEETKRTERPWTPGPWAKDYGLTVGHIKSTAQIDKSQTVARYDILPGLLMPEAEQQANAHLIAASPELFEALQIGLRAAESCACRASYNNDHEAEDSWDKKVAIIKAALAKALGGQP